MRQNKCVRHFTESSVQVRKSGEDGPSRVIEGYAIVFNRKSIDMNPWGNTSVCEVVDPSAISEALLNRCDVVMNIDHDDRLMLARSVNGEGSLTYTVDSKGVKFTFEAPNYDAGNKALELVRRGDIRGCSFAFIPSEDRDAVEFSDGDGAPERPLKIVRIKKIDKIVDFSLVTHPAYPDTSVGARSLAGLFGTVDDRWREDVAAMRAATKKRY